LFRGLCLATGLGGTILHKPHLKNLMWTFTSVRTSNLTWYSHFEYEIFQWTYGKQISLVIISMLVTSWAGVPSLITWCDLNVSYTTRRILYLFPHGAVIKGNSVPLTRPPVPTASRNADLCPRYRDVCFCKQCRWIHSYDKVEMNVTQVRSNSCDTRQDIKRAQEQVGTVPTTKTGLYAATYIYIYMHSLFCWIFPFKLLVSF
jgi:hypothetical protein